MALAHRPPLLLLDEPTDGLDPLMRDETLGALADHLAESPTTVLVSTHHVDEVERLADHIGVLQAGQLGAQLCTDALRAGLLRYRAEVPAGWNGAPSLNGAVLRRSSSAREIDWIVWGTEVDVAGALTASGATIRDASSLTLADAAVVLLETTRRAA
jgi:ABC-2 type transport system ATP-binding protein